MGRRVRLNTRRNPHKSLPRLAPLVAGAVALVVLASGVGVGMSTARPTVAHADPGGAAAPAGDSLEAAASEVVTLETTTLRLQREHAELTAAIAANRTETAETRAKLAETKANRRERAVRTYMKSFSGESLDDLLRPSLSSERLEKFSSAADDADQTGIKTMQTRLVELAGQLHAAEAALAANTAQQATSQERLDEVKAKLAASSATIGPAGPVAAASPGPGPVADAARAAADALRAADFAMARAAAALAAAAAAPADKDAAAVAFRAALEAQQPKTEYEAKRQRLTEVVDAEVGADGPALAAIWAATPTPALRAMYFALSQVGKDYVYATSGPNTYDCSGLTRRAWAESGIGLPHFSGAQLGAGTRVATGDLRPGDLLAYGPAGGEHVVMYIGDGWDVEAKGTAWGVMIDHADTSSDRYAGASRPVA
jgi:cell wall-associated NlpC family hydrolase